MDKLKKLKCKIIEKGDLYSACVNHARCIKILADELDELTKRIRKLEANNG